MNITAPVKETMIISLPAGYSVSSIPANRTISFSGWAVTYSCSYNAKNRVIVCERETNISGGSIEPELLSDLRKFFMEIQEKDREGIVLKKT